MPEIIEDYCVAFRNTAIVAQVAGLIQLWVAGKRMSRVGFRNGVRP